MRIKKQIPRLKTLYQGQFEKFDKKKFNRNVQRGKNAIITKPLLTLFTGSVAIPYKFYSQSNSFKRKSCIRKLQSGIIKYLNQWSKMKLSLLIISISFLLSPFANAQFPLSLEIWLKNFKIDDPELKVKINNLNSQDKARLIRTYSLYQFPSYFFTDMIDKEVVNIFREFKISESEHENKMLIERALLQIERLDTSGSEMTSKLFEELKSLGEQIPAGTSDQSECPFTNRYRTDGISNNSSFSILNLYLKSVQTMSKPTVPERDTTSYLFELRIGDLPQMEVGGANDPLLPAGNNIVADINEYGVDALSMADNILHWRYGTRSKKVLVNLETKENADTELQAEIYPDMESSSVGTIVGKNLSWFNNRFIKKEEKRDQLRKAIRKTLSEWKRILVDEGKILMLCSKTKEDLEKIFDLQLQEASKLGLICRQIRFKYEIGYECTKAISSDLSEK